MGPDVNDQKAQSDAKSLFTEFKRQIAGEMPVEELTVHGHNKNAGKFSELDFKNNVQRILGEYGNISEHYAMPTAFNAKKAASFNDVMNAINNGRYENPRTQAEATAAYFMRNVRTYSQDLADKESTKLTAGGH
ncbi:TPA: hypothetical protein HA238_04565 [Candidatus Micrarchaeota archaeon]|nr:hypothetical protein [Candidatus Micrarchaeota archaeon]